MAGGGERGGRETERVCSLKTVDVVLWLLRTASGVSCVWMVLASIPCLRCVCVSVHFLQFPLLFLLLLHGAPVVCDAEFQQVTDGRSVHSILAYSLWLNYGCVRMRCFAANRCLTKSTLLASATAF